MEKFQRSRETLDSTALAKLESLMKVHVKTLDDKYYNEDVESVCKAYSEIFEFVVPLTHRLNAATITKMASSVFESDTRHCIAFGRAIADAFSYINGKAQRFVDGSKAEYNPTVLKLMKLASKRNAKDTEREVKISRGSTRETPVVRAASRSSMSSAEILELYGAKPLEASDHAEPKRSLQAENSMGGESIMSINSSAPGSPPPASATASAPKAPKEAEALTSSEPLVSVGVATRVTKVKDRLPRHN